MKALVLAVVVMVAGACSSSTAPKATVAGTWSGLTGTQLLTMTLVENAGSVTGSGTLTNTPSGTLAMSITGTFTGTTISLTLVSGLHPAINLAGTIAGNTMTGSLEGSGFSGDGITLTR